MTETNSPTFFLIDFVKLLLFCGILQWVFRFQSLYCIVLSFSQLKVEYLLPQSKIQGNNNKKENLKSQNAEKKVGRTETEQFCLNEESNLKLTSREVEMVMKKMDMSLNPDGDKLRECIGSDELSELFVETEPSLGELKEAFNVFDENRDGFVDAKELQRVLCSLGFEEAMTLDACQKMIRAFDANGDDRIDFNEFVKFMENGIC